MNRLQKAAILSALAEALRRNQSWTGETHVQKASYFLQQLTGVPLDYEFVLYKHGPYSFRLHDELSELNGDGFLVVEPQAYPYGPKLSVTPLGERNMERHAHIVQQFEPAIARIADFVGTRTVNDLEKVATAYMLHAEAPKAPPDELAERLHQVKPHVSRFEALAAINEVRDALPELTS